MRLGEQLVADGLVLPTHVERVLAVQARRGMRIGSLLVDAQLVTADAVARALGRQRTIPAALERHLEGNDPELAWLVPAELARRHVILPVARARDGGVVIAMRDPRDAALVAELAQLIGHPVVPAVACELILRRHIERAYPAPVEEVEVDLDSGPMPVISGDLDLELGPPTDILDPMTVRAQPARPVADFDPDTIRVGSLVSLDDVGVARDHRATDLPPGARKSGSLIAQQQPAPAPGAVVPAMPSGPRGGSTPRPLPIQAPSIADGASAALTRIATATTRDAVIAAVVDHGRAGLDALFVLAVRQGMVFGDAGFAPELNRAAVEAMSLPLNQPSVLKTCADTARPYSGRPPVGSAIQDRLLKLLGKPPGIVVAPITLGGRVVSLLVGGTRSVEDAARAGAELVAIAGACSAAYARLRS